MRHKKNKNSYHKKCVNKKQRQKKQTLFVGGEDKCEIVIGGKLKRFYCFFI